MRKEGSMQPPQDPGEIYRLIVTRRNACEILFLQDGSSWKLPQISIRPRERVAEQLVSKVSEKWGPKTYCLFVPNAPSSNRNGIVAKCAVMESVRHHDKAPSGTCWVPTSTADGNDAGDAAAIKESLEELDSYVIGARTGP